VSIKRRQGFTLVEVLVILAILALLVGVLVPTITNQVRKGDVQSVSSDLGNIRTGMEAFLSDVHRYPGQISHLSNRIVVAQSDIHGAVYPASLVTKWKGPYISKDTVNAGFPTGFGGLIQNALRKNQNTNLIDYETILITGIASADFYEIDALIDAPVDTINAKTKGLLRVSAVGDTVKYLVMPIN
jgi:prepilin-type N-terminal cleavage/methylation domain-containing protein